MQPCVKTPGPSEGTLEELTLGPRKRPAGTSPDVSFKSKKESSASSGAVLGWAGPTRRIRARINILNSARLPDSKISLANRITIPRIIAILLAEQTLKSN